MYKGIIRPLLFAFPPEGIHRAVAKLLPVFFSIPGVKPLMRKTMVVRDPRLERKLFGLRFPNPVGVAAGFDKEVSLYNELGYMGFSHVEIGTITPRAQAGNPKPRLFRLPEDQALINRMGFNNLGAEDCITKLKKKNPQIIVGGNIGKNTSTPNEKAADDYCFCFEKLFSFVDYFVINVSCPNIKDLQKLQDKDETLKILHAIQNINKAKDSPKPVLLKISPDLSHGQLDDIIDIIRETGLQGIVATNTSPLRENLQTPREKISDIGQGGLSGMPIKHKSTRTIAYLHKKTGGTIPIIGAGGIFSAADAIEKLQAGASLVQVYTGFIYQGPGIAKQINSHLMGCKNQYHSSV